ncbi:hypothetical protein [Prevotella pallens]|uniref:hypothetical protein n=1 Tax=Prevotella pallens TaxID=60133 RepID=UPI00352F2824
MKFISIAISSKIYASDVKRLAISEDGDPLILSSKNKVESLSTPTDSFVFCRQSYVILSNKTKE